MSADALDRIALRGLRVYGRHGAYAAERSAGQDFVVDVVLGVDTHPAAATDALSETVDYGELAVRLGEVVGGEPVNLIETLAARLADVCLTRGSVREATVTVHKPDAPMPVPFVDVSVTITRSRT